MEKLAPVKTLLSHPLKKAANGVTVSTDVFRLMWKRYKLYELIQLDRFYFKK